MADTSRKRSRKSKLVPRECFVGEDDLELQIPLAKITKNTNQKRKKVSKLPEPAITKPEDVCDISVLKKINASAKEGIKPQSKISPRKFEIDIEVESCVDDDEMAGNGDENLPSSPPIKIYKNPIVQKVLRPIPITLSRDLILDTADNILKNSTNIADKYLNVYVRNTVGYEEKQKLVLNRHEDRIQTALEEWRTWQFRSFHRENPLFYKCYICTRSWWHLSDFRDHMSRQHNNDMEINIVLEKYEMHEANLIAFHYHKRLVVINDIYTEGLCYRCGKDYAAHELGSRYQEKFYKNEGCTRHFFCCMGLRDHLPYCPLCKVQDKQFKCDICRSRFDTEDDINDHLVLSHSVRSDIPIMTRYKSCKRCSERYSCNYVHKCGQKGPLLECPHCFQCFLNAKSLEIHMENSSKGYPCEVCNAVMTYSCKIIEHMMLHTNKYMIVRKCIACEGLNVFINKDDAIAHRSLKHDNSKLQNYFPKLLVPSSCVYQRLAESESVQLELVPIEHVSVPEAQISVPEEEISVPEEQKSVPEEQNSVLEESVPETDRELVPACKRKTLLQEELDSASEFIMDNVIIKQESEDSEYSPRLVIKEEPFDEEEYQINCGKNRTENFEHQINVKEEYIEEEEIDEDEEDIIKLNFDIEDLLEKEDSAEEDDRETVESIENRELEEDDDDSQESLSTSLVIMTPAARHTRTYKCKKCGFTGVHKEYKYHIVNDCAKTKGKHKTYIHQTFSCTKCQKEFTSMKKYLTHFEDHGYKYLSCPECLTEFHSFTKLGHHVHAHVKQNFVRVKKITHTGKAMAKPDYQCKKCGINIGNTEFFEHWESHINAHPTHPMKVTSRPRPSKKHGELHETIIKECIAQLSKQPKECNHCHHRFKRINECKRHIIEHLLADAYNQKHIYKELKCQVCDSGFPVPEKYKQHMRDHASLPVYKCELCDRTFSDSSNFTKHKKVHNLKVLVCDICQKKFQSKLSLAKHMEKHQKTKPITCKLCKKVFYFDSPYRRHVRYFHEKVTIGYRCVICSERFDSLKFKWDHMWEVHKERKHKADCPICHKSFRKYSDVRAHAKTDHLMEVSVISVKDSKNTKINISKYLKNAASIKVGRVETLVVYDSE